MKTAPPLFTFIEISKMTELPEPILFAYVEKKWINPSQHVNNQALLDHEDLARIQLIKELQHDFGVNDESIPLILHLIDQLHYLRNEIRAKS